MKRREFITKTSTGSLLSGIGLEQLIHQKRVYAAQRLRDNKKPLVTIAASNESSLRNPAPLDIELTYDQVRDIVWLALDRDTSSRSLLNIVKKERLLEVMEWI